MAARQVIVKVGCEYADDAHAKRVEESEGGEDKSSARNASSTPPSLASTQLSMR